MAGPSISRATSRSSGRSTRTCAGRDKRSMENCRKPPRGEAASSTRLGGRARYALEAMFCETRGLSASVDNAPSLYARQPEFYAVQPLVDKWIVRSRQAAAQFATLGIEAEWAPYCVDPKTFFRLPPNDTDLQALRRQLGLPADAYVIGNFHSDTAFTIGPDRPKWQKGPDIFAEIVRRVREAEPRVCVLLAGPRRHWLRQRLRSLDVPVFFVGREIAGDDFASNILDRPTLNRLYNLLDLYLICSRWEGGPHSILEACFSQDQGIEHARRDRRGCPRNEKSFRHHP